MIFSKIKFKKIFIAILIAVFTLFSSGAVLEATAKGRATHTRTLTKKAKAKGKKSKKAKKSKKIKNSKKSKKGRKNKKGRKGKRRGRASYISSAETSMQKKLIAAITAELKAHPDLSGDHENLDETSYVWPVTYGYISRGLSRWHRGIDIMSREGQPIYAVEDGTVTAVSINNAKYRGYGKLCTIFHEEHGTTSLYSHCKAIYVTVGQKVRRGQKIAIVGRTGLTTTNHLHFEMMKGGRRINPERVLPREGALGHSYVPH